MEVNGAQPFIGAQVIRLWVVWVIVIRVEVNGAHLLLEQSSFDHKSVVVTGAEVTGAK